jgi:hypothetical protein
MNPILAALVVIVILQIVALAAAVVARYWVLRSATFELHGIDVARATDLVAFYVQGVHDSRFGFPTGVFAVDPDQTSPGTVVAREINLKGSAGFGPIIAGLKLPIIGLTAGLAMAEGADDAGAGCLVGMIGGMMGFAIGTAAAIVVIVPCAFVTVVEMILRVLMRAEVRAEIAPVAGKADTVQVHFDLRGLSAFGIERQLRRGMEPPRPRNAPLPPPDPAATGAPVSQFDRLNTVYLSAASVALLCSIVAIILIGNAEHSPSGAAAAYAYEESAYSEPYEEEAYEPYEEEPYVEEEAEQYEEEPYAEEEPHEETEYEPEDLVATPFEAARNMFRRYWTSIDEGHYGAAYNVYYRSFGIQEGVSKGEFVASENEYLPEIGLARMTIEESERNPTSPNELWLYVEVPIRDTVGEFAGQCRLFYGDVRMFHADGRWYYRPGVAFGRKPSFGQEGGGIRVLPPGSGRCS